jgi:hypothetical protein
MNIQYEGKYKELILNLMNIFVPETKLKNLPQIIPLLAGDKIYFIK